MNRRGFLAMLGFGIPAVLLAPKVFAAQAVEVVNNTNERWFAPAGFNRGSFEGINRAQLIVKIREAMALALENSFGEINDSMTRARIQSEIVSKMENFRSCRLIQDYHVVCNEANNPPYRIEQGIVNVDVSVQPNTTIESFMLVASMTHEGVEFTEFNNEIARRFE